MAFHVNDDFLDPPDWQKNVDIIYFSSVIMREEYLCGGSKRCSSN
jgi:hypothetical protein